ncbi:MAG: hypothetical protein LC101_01225 [Flavobacteriales bacterium]|nr:hypothetical protein [Flavobacteriales bacterium]MCZ2442392.1 hypothetical protein [Flavobacteriales bacterium]
MRLSIIAIILLSLYFSACIDKVQVDPSEKFLIRMDNPSIAGFESDYTCEITLYNRPDAVKLKTAYLKLQKKNLEIADGSTYYIVERYVHNVIVDYIEVESRHADESKYARQLLDLIDTGCP